MTHLPRELAPWAAYLDSFPDEAAQTIWPWLPRLHAVLGDIHLPSENRSGEADGFDGLTRHGLYDRLIASEWVLLDLLPEEFLRRAAMSEQLYLKPARKSPQEAKRSVMLFDAGPDQFGAPRLVHLALLITMARRAQTSRTSFAWGILQKPTDLFEGFSPEHLSRLVESRTWETPKLGHVDRWTDALAPLQPDDLWIVGSPGLTRMHPLQRSSTIVVDPPFEIPATSLAVSVARHGNAPHMKVRLDVPKRGVGVHLLRASAYKEQAVLAAEETFSSQIQLSWDGRRLLTRGLNSGLLAYHIPNTSREAPGRTRRLDPGRSGSLLAAALDERKWSWVTLDEGRMYLHGPKTKSFRSEVDGTITVREAGGFVSGKVVAPPDDACPSHIIPGCHFLCGEHTRSGIAFTDGHEALVGISSGRIVFYKTHTSFCIDTSVELGRSLLYLENPPAGPRRLVHSAQGEITEHPFELSGDGTFELVNRRHQLFSDRVFGVNDVGRRWRFCSLDGKKCSLGFDLEAPAGSRVVGWMHWRGPSGGTEPRLICCTEESGLVLSASATRTEVFYNTFKPIRSCVFHSGRAILALSTDHELVAYSLDEGSVLLRVKRGRR